MRKAPFATLAATCGMLALGTTKGIEYAESQWLASQYEAQPNTTESDASYLKSLQEKFGAACQAGSKTSQIEAEQELTLMANDRGWNITIQECVLGRPFNIGPIYRPSI